MTKSLVLTVNETFCKDEMPVFLNHILDTTFAEADLELLKNFIDYAKEHGMNVDAGIWQPESPRGQGNSELMNIFFKYIDDCYNNALIIRHFGNAIQNSFRLDNIRSFEYLIEFSRKYKMHIRNDVKLVIELACEFNCEIMLQKLIHFAREAKEDLNIEYFL